MTKLIYYLAADPGYYLAAIQISMMSSELRLFSMTAMTTKYSR